MRWMFASSNCIIIRRFQILNFWGLSGLFRGRYNLAEMGNAVQRSLYNSWFPHAAKFFIFGRTILGFLWIFSATRARLGSGIRMSCAKLMRLWTGLRFQCCSRTVWNGQVSGPRVTSRLPCLSAFWLGSGIICLILIWSRACECGSIPYYFQGLICRAIFTS